MLQVTNMYILLHVIDNHHVAYTHCVTSFVIMILFIHVFCFLYFAACQSYLCCNYINVFCFMLSVIIMLFVIIRLHHFNHDITHIYILLFIFCFLCFLYSASCILLFMFCFLYFASCILLLVFCFLCFASYVLLLVFCFLYSASYVLLLMFCFLYSASCILLFAFCFLCFTSCILLLVFYFLCSASCILLLVTHTHAAITLICVFCSVSLVVTMLSVLTVSCRS